MGFDGKKVGANSIHGDSTGSLKAAHWVIRLLIKEETSN